MRVKKNIRKSAPRKNKGVSKKSKTDVADFAGCSVTRSLVPGRMNAAFAFDSFSLQDYQRAAGIAQYYQHYRITGITVTWKPAYDTYSQATILQKPNLYYMIDKAGAIPDNFTLEGLKQMGSKPHAFDEKPLRATWRPSVLQEDLNLAGAASATQYKVSPWLSTNANATNPGLWAPSTVAHQGLKWYIEEASGSATAVQMEVQIQFQFKKPLMPSLAAVPALSLAYATIDASPDGVEGGSDGITIPLASLTYPH